MTARLYYRFRGVPLKRLGGPWWYDEFATSEEAKLHHYRYMAPLLDAHIIEEVMFVESAQLEPHGDFDIYPPKEAQCVGSDWSLPTN